MIIKRNINYTTYYNCSIQHSQYVWACMEGIMPILITQARLLSFSLKFYTFKIRIYYQNILEFEMSFCGCSTFRRVKNKIAYVVVEHNNYYNAHRKYNIMEYRVIKINISLVRIGILVFVLQTKTHNPIQYPRPKFHTEINYEGSLSSIRFYCCITIIRTAKH